LEGFVWKAIAMCLLWSKSTNEEKMVRRIKKFNPIKKQLHCFLGAQGDSSPGTLGDMEVKMDKDIIFYTATSDTIPAVLKDMDLKYSDDLPVKFRVTLAIDFSSYERVYKNGYFHIKNNSNIFDFEFDIDKPVIIELKPNNLLMKKFTIIGNRHSIEKSIQVDDEEGVAIRNEINWYATTISQEVDIPEDMVGEGIVLEGYTTEYEDVEGEEDETDTGDYLKDLMDENKDIESVLKKYDIPYIRDDDGFSGNVTLNDNKWGFFIYERDRIFIICSTYPFFAEEEQYDRLCREITSINSELLTGNFDLDMEEGVISFRISYDAGEDYMAPDAFERMLIANMATTGKYYSRFKKLVK
jgi:Uncharacterized conserved protein